MLLLLLLLHSLPLPLPPLLHPLLLQLPPSGWSRSDSSSAPSMLSSEVASLSDVGLRGCVKFALPSEETGRGERLLPPASWPSPGGGEHVRLAAVPALAWSTSRGGNPGP